MYSKNILILGTHSQGACINLLLMSARKWEAGDTFLKVNLRIFSFNEAVWTWKWENDSSSEIGKVALVDRSGTSVVVAGDFWLVSTSK